MMCRRGACSKSSTFLLLLGAGRNYAHGHKTCHVCLPNVHHIVQRTSIVRHGLLRLIIVGMHLPTHAVAVLSLVTAVGITMMRDITIVVLSLDITMVLILLLILLLIMMMLVLLLLILNLVIAVGIMTLNWPMLLVVVMKLWLLLSLLILLLLRLSPLWLLIVCNTLIYIAWFVRLPALILLPSLAGWLAGWLALARAIAHVMMFFLLLRLLRLFIFDRALDFLASLEAQHLIQPVVVAAISAAALVGFGFARLLRPRGRSRDSPGRVPVGAAIHHLAYGLIFPLLVRSGRRRVARRRHVGSEGRRRRSHRPGARPSLAGGALVLLLLTARGGTIRALVLGRATTRLRKTLRWDALRLDGGEAFHG